MSITVAPTCIMALIDNLSPLRSALYGPADTDVVVDVQNLVGCVELRVPFPVVAGSPSVVLLFTADQLAALMDALVEASELVMS